MERDEADRDAQKESGLEPKHKIFLNHSGAQKSFVEALCVQLEGVRCFAFFDKRTDSLPWGERFPEAILAAARQCQVAVVVLSEEYFTRSKWPMIELIVFMQQPESSVKIIPLFFKISLSDLRDPERQRRWVSVWKAWAAEDPRIKLSEWEDALKRLPSFAGMEYFKQEADSSDLEDPDSLKAYLDKVVEALGVFVNPDVLHGENARDNQGKGRICQEILAKFERPGGTGARVVGFYGMGGIGKTTFCKLLCDVLEKEFAGKVCHLELGHQTDKLELLMLVIRSLTNTAKSRGFTLWTMSQFGELNKGPASELEMLELIQQLNFQSQTQRTAICGSGDERSFDPAKKPRFRAIDERPLLGHLGVSYAEEGGTEGKYEDVVKLPNGDHRPVCYGESKESFGNLVFVITLPEGILKDRYSFGNLAFKTLPEGILKDRYSFGNLAFKTLPEEILKDRYSFGNLAIKKFPEEILKDRYYFGNLAFKTLLEGILKDCYSFGNLAFKTLPEGILKDRYSFGNLAFKTLPEGILKDRYSFGNLAFQTLPKGILKDCYSFGNLAFKTLPEGILKDYYSFRNLAFKTLPQGILKDRYSFGNLAFKTLPKEILKDCYSFGNLAFKTLPKGILKDRYYFGNLAFKTLPKEILKDRYYFGNLAFKTLPKEILKDRYYFGNLAFKTLPKEILKDCYYFGNLAFKTLPKEILKDCYSFGNLAFKTLPKGILKDRYSFGNLAFKTLPEEILKDRYYFGNLAFKTLPKEILKDRYYFGNLAFKTLPKEILKDRYYFGNLAFKTLPKGILKDHYSFGNLAFKTISEGILKDRYSLENLAFKRFPEEILKDHPANGSDSSYKPLLSKDLESVRVLGKGYSGIVYEILWRGGRYARKDFFRVPSDIFEREVRALVRLASHPNVVQAFGWTVDKSSCSLVQERMDGNLWTLTQRRKKFEQERQGRSDREPSPKEEVTPLQKLTGEALQASSPGSSTCASQTVYPFPMPEAVDIIVKIAEGTKFLHDNEVAHGDLKPRNILVKRKPPHQELALDSVKVADYGLIETKPKSRCMTSASSDERTLESVRWTAPELINDSSGSSLRHGFEDSAKMNPFKCDVYSFAMVCYEVMTDFTVNTSFDRKELVNDIVTGQRPNLPPNCPQRLGILAKQCWAIDPTERPSFDHIVKELKNIQRGLEEEMTPNNHSSTKKD